MSNDNDIISRGASERTTITDFFFNVGDDCAFGHDTKGENVANCKVCLFAGVDELACVHAFVGDEGFCAMFVAVGIAEDNFGERGTAAGVVDNFFHNATEVAMSFGILQLVRYLFTPGFVEGTSRTLNFAAPFRRRVWDWKMPPDFLWRA
jgi:hypothetical protein